MASNRARNVVLIASVGCMVALFIAVLVATMSYNTTRNAPRTPTHPSPLALAQKYMTAIADGDADTANSIDKKSFGMHTDGIDNNTFVTGDALKNATERIHKITYKLGGNFNGDSWVNTYYVLAGKSYESQLQFSWGKTTKSWHLNYPISNLISVETYFKTDVDNEPVQFSLGGVAAVPLPDGSLPFTALAYPAVYPLTVKIDPSFLADPASVAQSLLVPPDPHKGGDIGLQLKAPRP